jgi:hypothetical protein
MKRETQKKAKEIKTKHKKINRKKEQKLSFTKQNFNE